MLELERTGLVPESLERKKAIVDIRAIDENERQLSIELQRESQPEFITNMIESYHRQLCKVTKRKSIFPSDEGKRQTRRTYQ